MALGEIYMLVNESFYTDKKEISDVDAELSRLRTAVKQAAGRLGDLMAVSEKTCGSENAQVFDYQLLLLEDDEYIGKITKDIQDDRVNAEFAVDAVSSELIDHFSGLEDMYLKARAVDIMDLRLLLQTLLAERRPFDAAQLKTPFILAADDLTPSQTAILNPSACLGILTAQGSPSSHSVIIARALGIPYVIGIHELMKEVRTGQEVLINGDTGEIFSPPQEEQRATYEAYLKRLHIKRDLLAPYIDHETVTLDGFKMKILANITSEKETELLLKNGGEGVGLLRTEFIYMSAKAPPSRTFQAAVYRSIAKKAGWTSACDQDPGCRGGQENRLSRHRA